jgi:hypothetical protein
MKFSTTAKLGIVLMAVVVPAVICGYIIYGFAGRNRLIAHNEIIMGKISGCTKEVKGRPEACNVRYRYSLNGKEYEGATLFGPSELRYEDCLKYLAGHAFPVVYETGNAGNSVILLTPTACRLYSYNFPDSLKWVAQYVREK